MSEHVRDSGQVGRETVLRPSEVPLPVLAEGTAPVQAILAEGTAPVAFAYPTPPARRVWPWLAGAAVLAATAATGYVLIAERSERTAFEATYPIVVDAGERAALADDAARWSRGTPRTLAMLTRFSPPALETLTGAGACPLATDDGSDDVTTADDPDALVSTQVIVMPGESLEGLDVIARDEIARMIEAANRGRFRSEDGRTRIERALRGAFVVAIVTDHQLPGIGRDGAPRTGTATGVAYAYDPATGALRCAGSFRSDADEDSFDRATSRAIATSLRAID